MSKHKGEVATKKPKDYARSFSLEAQSREEMIPEVFGLFPDLEHLLSAGGGGVSRVQDIADRLTEPIRKIERSARAKRLKKLKLVYGGGSFLSFVPEALRDQILAEMGGVSCRKGNSTFLCILNAVEDLPDDKVERQAVQRARSEMAGALSHAFHSGWTPAELVDRLANPGESIRKWARSHTKRCKDRVEKFRLAPDNKHIVERNNEYYGSKFDSPVEVKERRIEAEREEAIRTKRAAEVRVLESDRRQAESRYIEEHATEMNATLSPDLANLSRELLLWVRLGKGGRVQKVRGVRCIGSRKPATEEMEDIFQQVSALRLEA